MRSDDFREELLSAKKAHQLALRENTHFRTRLRIAESECRRREAQIERLLKAQANDGIAEGKSARARLDIASLRRKVMLYERMLQEKSAENEKLMSDKDVTQATETRKMMNRLESECQRLRSHLAQSVPESEFMREKEQYTAIINKLVEENMHLRSVIGQFEQRRKESERIIAQLGGSDALVRQFRQTAISSRRQANFYRKALGNLIKRKRNGSREREIVSVGEEGGKDGEGWKRDNGARERSKSESDSSKQSEEARRNSSKNGETEEGKSETESDQKKMKKKQMQDEEKEEEKNAEEKSERKRAESDRSSVLLSSRSSSTPPPATTTFPRGTALTPTRVSSTASSSRVDNEEEQREEEENEEEEKEIEESQLNALFRVLHSHILRQQMLKVRREREDCPNMVGMSNFY